MNQQGEIIMSEAINGSGVNECGGSPQPAAKKRYVRHISGQGEKWEVLEHPSFPTLDGEWPVCAKDGRGWHSLPKSEYELCKPVKKWVDVTAQCRESHGDILHCVDGAQYCVISELGLANLGYRFVRVVHPIIVGSMLTDRAFLIVEHEEDVPDGV